MCARLVGTKVDSEIQSAKQQIKFCFKLKWNQILLFSTQNILMNKKFDEEITFVYMWYIQN